MLLPYTTITYYGPGACAMVVEDSIGQKEGIEIRGDLRVGADSQGTGELHYMRPIRLRGFPMSAQGLGEVHAFQPRMNARMGLDVKIGTLTQDDVTGAVMESRVEGDITLKQALRLMLARLTGNATGLDGTSITFKSMDGTKTRIAGTVISGTRTISTRDGE